MKTEENYFRGTRGTRLPWVLWTPEGETKIVLQVVHGMTEHMGRYREFAEHMTEEGIAVAGFDLRGHGKNPGDPECASMGDKGWEASLEDMHIFYQQTSLLFPGIPYAMMGFSLGSFLLRDYLNEYRDRLSSAIIAGTGSQPGNILRMLKSVTEGQIRRSGFDKDTPLVKALSFGAYNKKFFPAKTEADWLCSDSAELGRYMNDPFCRHSISSGLFWQLLDSMERTENLQSYHRWPKHLPVLLISGKNDPVGRCGKGVKEVMKDMEKAGMTDVKMKLISGARHDIFHEKAGGAADETLREIKYFLISKATGSEK